MSKAAAAGLSVIHFQKPGLYSPDVVQYCEQVHLFDYQDIDQVSAISLSLHKVRPFSHIFTQSEIGQLVVGHLNDLLNLPGNTYETFRTLHDKLTMRTVLNKEGIGPVDAAALDGPETLRAFLTKHGSAVVKPTMASGSLGVRVLAQGDDPDEVWQWTQTFGSGAFMVEERLVGLELSVESFTLEGRHNLVAITEKDTDGGVIELGHVTPARVSASTALELNAFTERALNAIGVIEGTCHTELMLTVDGPRVIESHNRLGGDGIPKLVELATGIDMESLTFLPALPAGSAEPEPKESGAAAVCFLTATPGRVVALEGVDEALEANGVIEVHISAKVGSTVRPLLWSDDRCGHVMVHAEDASTAVSLARQIASTISIRTEPIVDSEVWSMAAYLTEVEEELDPFTR